MAETQKEKEDRLRREAEAKDRTGGDSSFVAVNTLPRKETATTATGMKETARTEARSTTEKIGATLHEAKEAVTPDRAETGRPGTIPPPGRTTSTTTSRTTREEDWEKIRHPGMEPCDEDPYGTRPVAELAKPTDVKDKADLAAIRMLEREKVGREQMDRERIMSTATTEAAAARAALASKEGASVHSPTDDRLRTGAAATGAVLVGVGAAATRITPEAGERTTRQGAAIDTERPVTGTVAPATTTTPTTRITPVPTTTTPLKPYGTVDERARRHAEDQSVHPDWETQPQINAPRDVGIPTAERLADAARIRAGRRRSDEAEEPRIDRRGGDYEIPAASGARTGPMREKARDIKEDVDRKI